jgi:hypothetical protein
VRKEDEKVKGRWKGTYIVALGFILAGCFQYVAPEAMIPRITKEELRSWLSSPDVIILDVRQPDDWNKSKEKISGAVHEDPEKDITSWATKYRKDKTFVFYCA